ncbi:MAG: DUF3987 domain-containing protein [Rhodomicrobium sp.]
MLMAAATACGLPRAEARSTIRSGLEAGMRQPRQFEDTGGVTPPAAEGAGNSEYAQRIWRESRPAAGTLAEVYLGAVRGLQPGDALEALGFHHGLYHSEAKQHLPAMVAPVYRPGGAEPCAVHITYLNHDGAKASVEPARRMLGPVKGGAVWLCGPDDDGPLIITEGIEKAIACRHASGFQVWVALSASLMPVMELPAAAQSITICADRGAAGEAAAEKAAARWAAEGCEIRICFPPTDGKDWDECLPEDVRQAIASAPLWRPTRHPKALVGDAFDWPEPDRTVVQTPAAPPPLDLALLSPLDGMLRSLAESKGAACDAIVLALLISASVFIGVARRARPWNGWNEPGILWGALVMPPSHNKSPALDPFRDALHHAEQVLGSGFVEEQRKYEAAKIAAEAARTNWEVEVKDAVKMGYPPPPLPAKAETPEAPVRPRLWAADVTAQKAARLMKAHPGLLVYRDELAGWIGSFGQFSNGGASDRAFWLECYGGRPHRIDRVGDGELDVPFAAASVLGAITPDGLSDLVLGGARDGFAARYVFIWPEPVPPKRPIGGEDAAPQLNRLFSRLAQIQMDLNASGAPAPRDLPLSEDAAAAFDRWRIRHDAKAKAASGLQSDALGKQPGLCLRIALIMEHIFWAAREEGAEPTGISLVAVDRAIRLIDGWVTPHLDRVLADAGTPKADTRAMALARWLLKQRLARFNASHLRRLSFQHLAGMRLAKDMDEACAELADAGWIRRKRCSDHIFTGVAGAGMLPADEQGSFHL